MSTYVPIQAITLSATASSIEFTGIPQTYTDLVLVCNVTASASATASIRFNGDSSSLYSFTQMFGNGSTASSNRTANTTSISIGYPFTSIGTTTLQIQNYSNTVTNKTILTRDSNASNFVATVVGLWRNTAAISSLTINLSTGTFSSGSTFTLYGIGSGAPKAFGGDEVRTDGTYWYHIFRSSGRFEPVQALTCDYLVVAGGGSGASYTGGDATTGGGGAGGLRCTVGATGGGGTLESPLSLSANTSYTVTIGAGGTGVINAIGSNGSNSTFATITSTGGGGGGRWTTLEPGKSGGSGGGSGAYTQANAGGAGTTGQGYKGGDGSPSPSVLNNGAGGGGGAGAAGGNATNSGTAGAGGNGVTTTISGSSVTYAGGGGGTAVWNSGSNKTRGLGGTGGGGNGGTGGTVPGGCRV